MENLIDFRLAPEVNEKKKKRIKSFFKVVKVECSI